MNASQTPTGPIRRAIRTFDPGDTYRNATQRLNALAGHTPDPATTDEAIERVKLLQRQIHYTWAATIALAILAIIGLLT